MFVHEWEARLYDLSSNWYIVYKYWTLGGENGLIASKYCEYFEWLDFMCVRCLVFQNIFNYSWLFNQTVYI